MCAVCSARPLSQMIFMSSSTCRSEANKSTPLCVRFLFNYIISFDLMIFEAFVFPSRRVDNSGEESQIAHTSVAMHTESHGTFCSSFESHTRIDVMSMENMRRSNCVRCDLYAHSKKPTQLIHLNFVPHSTCNTKYYNFQIVWRSTNSSVAILWISAQLYADAQLHTNAVISFTHS